MIVKATKLPGLLVIEPAVHRDRRGGFIETYHAKRYREIGIGHDFVQDNYSYSRRGVLRGLHYQNNYPQGKLVFVLLGEVYDVAVDLRPESSTFGDWYAEILSKENHRQLYIPPRFAHGFLVLSSTAHVVYKCTEFYRPDSERSLRWNDPEIGINWPQRSPLLSEKDALAPFLASFEKDNCVARS